VTAEECLQACKNEDTARGQSYKAVHNVGFDMIDVNCNMHYIK